MDELVIDNLVYIPSKKAAAVTGYAKDYIGQLCREGRIEAKLVGRSWYVLESSIKEHRFGHGGALVQAQAAVAAPVEAPQEEAIERSEQLPEALEAAVAEKPQESTDKPESTEVSREISLEIEHPTYLENTTRSEIVVKPSQIEEVQSAWQEWFSKNEGRTMPQAVPDQSVSLNIIKEEEEVVVGGHGEPYVSREAVQEISDAQNSGSVPVRIRRSTGGSMDIAVQPAVRRDTRTLRRAKTQMPRQTSSFPKNLIYKAAFVALMILTIAVTVVGTGALDIFSPTWAGNTPAVDYLAGVINIEK